MSKERQRRRARYVRGIGVGWRIALSCLWTLLVCYPDPRVLWDAVANTLNPPVDPAAVREWARTLPDEPAQIESAVLERVHYAVPWQTDGVPWSLPAPAQVIASGFGDCQARAVVLASVLAAKGIPYQLRASLDHMWVDYPGREGTGIEAASKVLWTRPETPGLGWRGFRLRLPQIDWAESYRIEKEYFWDTAPASRKLLLFAGLLVLWWPRRPR